MKTLNNEKLKEILGGTNTAVSPAPSIKPIVYQPAPISPPTDLWDPRVPVPAPIAL
ncbi:hypothetical protein [Thalassotalea marina]|uniref:Bacteriocin n=1 Tax=Thalassotalea marina TaxID=1673741 RepID=A0A919BPX1_9GAMM|nr:hypothetical protein [Thalassotalea marina]GHG03696.1 hypothetical protein GCM10017161_36200 [Thalassotalea marina]